MNKALAAADRVWGQLCLIVCLTLIGMFIWWMFLQPPLLTVAQSQSDSVYNVTAGSMVYLENPVIPPDTIAQVDYDGELHSLETKDVYSLDTVDSISSRVTEQVITTSDTVKPGQSLYGLFIPSYVRPGLYEFRMRATYRLNPFRSATLELPPVRIVVE